MSDRVVYVISDLHLGGAPPQASTAATGDDAELERRGFRMMTEPKVLAEFVRRLIPTGAELVINGDFIDFLAERHEKPPHFRPFLYDEDEALAVFRHIAGPSDHSVTRAPSGREGWDAEVFDALRAFVAKGRRLTILLGNHDLELCLPRVREELVRRLGGGDLHFRYDNEALTVGPDVLIEHGNLYDRANVVDHQGLRKLRAELSRGLRDSARSRFEPPVGSRLVSEIMNPIKARYGFIDLLKPEAEPLFALLIALEPDCRAQLAGLLKLLGDVPVDPVSTLRASGDGGRGAPPASPTRDGGRGRAPRDPVEKVLGELFGADDGARFLDDATRGSARPGSAERSAGSWLTSKLGLTQLLVGAGLLGSESRIAAVRRAMRALETDRCFSIDAESATYAERAKKAAADGGFRCVIFGHTHLAKDVTFGGVRYLNSGTWANLMRFPVLSPDRDTAIAELTAFIQDVRSNSLAKYVRFAPTFVRVDLRDDRLRDVGVYHYTPTVSLEEQPRFQGIS